MLKILFKQPVHIWQTLDRRHKIEAFLLVGLILIYLTSRLSSLLQQLLNESATPSGITLLAINLFTFTISLSALFILRWMIPRQQGLRLALTAPLTDKHFLQLFSFYGFKYLSTYLLLLLPVVFALSSMSIFYSLFALLSIFILSVSYYWIFILLKQKLTVFANGISFTVIFLLHTLFGYFYWQTDSAFLYQIIQLIAATVFCIFLYSTAKIRFSIERFVSYLATPYQKKGENIKYKRFRGPVFFPKVIQALFEKESLGLWRNAAYKKLKIYSLISFFIINLLIVFSQIESKEILIILFSALLIWIHYSNGFNEKYIFPDPDWFIRTLPIRFRQLLLAKYFAEIPFVMVLCFFAWLFLMAVPGPAAATELILILLVFAHIVLFTMLNFQIMFYNDPRLAGYAYHFTLIFVFIMIINYRLVGPVIALGLMIFFIYKNIKYFNN